MLKNSKFYLIYLLKLLKVTPLMSCKPAANLMRDKFSVVFSGVSVRGFQRAPVLHSLGHMRDLHRFGAGQVGDGARHFQAAVNAPA